MFKRIKSWFCPPAKKTFVGVKRWFCPPHVCKTYRQYGVEGYFGILPVEFCPDCFSSMCDMVEQYMGYTEEEEDE